MVYGDCSDGSPSLACPDVLSWAMPASPRACASLTLPDPMTVLWLLQPHQPGHSLRAGTRVPSAQHGLVTQMESWMSAEQRNRTAGLLPHPHRGQLFGIGPKCPSTALLIFPGAEKTAQPDSSFSSHNNDNSYYLVTVQGTEGAFTSLSSGFLTQTQEAHTIIFISEEKGLARKRWSQD